jgi:hypothetical protein
MNIKKEFVAVILASKEKIRSSDGTMAGDPPIHNFHDLLCFLIEFFL